MKTDFLSFLLNAEIHDEAEFGKAAAKLEYDENATTSASDLGLLVGNLVFNI